MYLKKKELHIYKEDKFREACVQPLKNYFTSEASKGCES